jgi:hypothetical protein
MTEVTLTHIGGPTVLLEVEGWRLLTDPTFDAPGRRYTFGWGSPPTRPAARRSPPPTWARSMWSLLSHDHHGDNLDDAGRALLAVAGVVLTTTPGARRLGGNARGLQPWATIRLEAELRAGEALVFDWTSLAFCCAAAGEISLRPTTLRKAQRSPAYLPLRTGDGSSVFAHRRAYPMLVGRDIEVDCRRRLGVRSFSSSLPRPRAAHVVRTRVRRRPPGQLGFRCQCSALLTHSKRFAEPLASCPQTLLSATREDVGMKVRTCGLCRVKGARPQRAPSHGHATHYNVARQRLWPTEATQCCAAW